MSMYSKSLYLSRKLKDLYEVKGSSKEVLSWLTPKVDIEYRLKKCRG